MTNGAARWGAVVGAVALLALPSPARAADTGRVAGKPAAIREKPSDRAPVVLVVSPGTALQTFDREGDWVWVIAEGDSTRSARAGWMRRESLTDAKPVSGATRIQIVVDTPPAPAAGGPRVTVQDADVVPVPPPPTIASLVDVAAAARAASAAAEAARRPTGSAPAPKSARAARATSAAPPEPVGGLPRSGGGWALGDWILPRGFRASVGFNYQSAYVSQAAGSLDESLRGGMTSVAASIAILDPRILAIDFAGDLQLNQSTSRASATSSRNKNGLNSYRLDVGILTGLKAPLRIVSDRVSSTSDLQPLGQTLDPTRHTQGVRRDLGFTWDVNADRLPRIQVSASVGRQDDERNYLFGYSSTNVERRAELRANRDHRLGRYDVDFTHGDYVYDVPAAGVRSETASDVFQASGRLAPSSRVELDVHGRATRFAFGTGERESRVSGVGADVSGRYHLGRSLSAVGRYSFSTNAFEAALSGRLSSAQPGATPVTSTAQLQERTRFHEGEARLEYTTRPFTAAAMVKDVSFGVPPYLAPTLSALTTTGALVGVAREWRGLSWRLGSDASVGRARSNRSVEEPYREAGIDGGVSRDVGATLRFGVDASARRTGRLTFFPVNLEARSATLHVETMRPGWARLRASITGFDNLRDVLYTDSRDRHLGYSFGLAGSRYDLTADLDYTDVHSLLLSPVILGARPDVAMLVASRPDLFRNLLAASDRTRALGLQVRPFRGMQLQARVRRQEQAYPGTFAFRVEGSQAWASYQLREIQLEFGWEYFDSWTSFGSVRDRRVYVRLRRDVTLF